MKRLALRKLPLLSAAVLGSLAILACGTGENTDDGVAPGTGGVVGAGGAGTGGALPTGGAGTGGGSAAGGTAPTGGSQSVGGTGAGGSPTTGGGSGTGGGASTGGANGTGGGSTAAHPIDGTDSYDCSPASGEIPPLMLTQLPGDLTAPVGMAHPPNDDRIFIITLGGDVMVIKDGALLPTPFLSLGNALSVGGAPGDERGLLGIAFHPDYATNGLMYLHFSAGTGIPNTTAGDTVIAEYKVSAGNPDVADPASRRIVMTVAQPNNGGTLHNHKGGAINFGPGKFLFIGLGDGGGSGDPPGNGQNTGALLGKMLRINPLADGGNAYSTPADNLVEEIPTAAPEVWDYGLRNPFRTSFDACTGDLYIADVGQNNWEEVDFEKVGEGHKNYGWNVAEGLHCYTGNSCDRTGFTDPLIEYDHNTGKSITGGAVYRGTAIPGLRGAYFYGDYSSNKVWYTFYDRDAHAVSTPVSVTQDLNAKSIVAISNGNDGELYFVSLGTISGGNLGPGGVYKLESAQ